MKKMLVALALLATPSGGVAAEGDYTDAATGLGYKLAVLEDGSATLTYEQDASEVFSLRPDCFATHPIYGIGFWKTDAGGWQVMIGGTMFLRFDGQPQPFPKSDCSKGLGDG